jgi:HPt (histidine-containing phosphotransfer) domain-containing protein
VNKNNKLILLDHDLLDDYLQSLGVEVIKKMLALYRQQMVIYLIDIEKSLQSNNAELWQEHCHKMKGAAGSIGLKSLHTQLALMEKTSADTTEKAQQLTELKDHNQQALANFNAWLEKYN